MNLVKSQDYFSPSDVRYRCHIIGCGSVGSSVAELLTRLGITNISLYDFDIVSSHNLANQMFFEADIGRPKVDALADLICRINNEAKDRLDIHPEGWTEKTKLSGYVFLCVDNIDLRRRIATKNKPNQSIKAMFDFRTGLENAQHFAANWENPQMIDDFINSMNFTHEEAKAITPKTACNVEIGVASTVRDISNAGVTNFMNFIRGVGLKKLILTDSFKHTMDAY